MKKILVKDKALRKLEIPLAILNKLERTVAYLKNHKTKKRKKGGTSLNKKQF